MRVSPANSTIMVATVRQFFSVADTMDWRSFDPYDLRLSPLLRHTPRHSRLLARIVIQIGRRTGAAPRRLLQVEPHEEAQALADFLRAAVFFARDGHRWARGYVAPLRQRLLAQAIDTQHGKGWGLSFPLSNRFVHVGARTPNIYQTVNAVAALLDTYESTGDQRAADYAADGLHFISRDLGCHADGGMTWLRYWPGTNDRIVNVQALAAGVFVRAARVFADSALARVSDDAVHVVVICQRPDGSWRYSEDGKANFVDGFHTGFILQGLADYAGYRDGGLAAAAEGALRRGLRYFKQHLLSPDGLPLAFANGRPATDGQTFAQCIQTLALCAEDASDVRRAARVWTSFRASRSGRAALTADRGGRAGWSPHYPALRWTLGPAALATAHLLRAAPRWGVQL